MGEFIQERRHAVQWLELEVWYMTWVWKVRWKPSKWFHSCLFVNIASWSFLQAKKKHKLASSPSLFVSSSDFPTRRRLRLENSEVSSQWVGLHEGLGGPEGCLPQIRGPGRHMGIGLLPSQNMSNISGKRQVWKLENYGKLRKRKKTLLHGNFPSICQKPWRFPQSTPGHFWSGSSQWTIIVNSTNIHIML